MDAGTALQQSTDATGGVGSLLQQEQTQLQPLYKQAQQTIAEPLPKPQLQNPPKAPEQQGQPGLEWMAAINVLAGIGGARARQGGTTALQAFGSGMTALKNKQIEQFNQASQQWKDANQQVLDTNKDQIEAYKEALQDKKLSVSEQMAEIQRIASEYHNDIMAQLAAGRNYDGVARTMDMMQKHTDDLQEKYDALAVQEGKISNGLKDIQGATKAYDTSYPKDPVTGKRPPGAPPFKDFLAKDWQTLKNTSLQQGGISAAPQATQDGRVPVISPDGTPGTVAADQLDAALAAGYKKQ